LGTNLSAFRTLRPNRPEWRSGHAHAKLNRSATAPSIVQMTRDLASFAVLIVVMFLVATFLVAVW
jgi:hypothetical protein